MLRAKSTHENAPYSKEILATYRGWDKLTRSQESDFIAQKSVIIADISHLDDPPNDFVNETEVLVSLAKLLKIDSENQRSF